VSGDDVTPRRRRRQESPPADEAILRPPSPDLAAVSDALSDTPLAPVPSPVIEAPSADVAAVPAASRLPGASRDGYSRLPTAPVATTALGPVEGESVPWTPPPHLVSRRRPPVLAAWALSFAVVALAASLFVGWMLPVGLIAIVAAIVALRRVGEPRGVAVWALVLAAVAVLYSAGWLAWALPQLTTG
jgi:hypothetical protein